jgi:DNA mismatch repair protein MutS2
MSDLRIETLNLLGWSRLCEHLSSFAQTKVGKRACEKIMPSENLALAQVWLERTGEAQALQARTVEGLSLAGVQDIDSALARIALGGNLEGDELLAVASTLAAARRLRRTIEDQAETLPALALLVADLRTFPEIEQEIYRCIDDSGEVADRASEHLRTLRGNHKRIRLEIQKILLQLLQRRPSCFQENVITQRGERFVVPVKVTHRDQVPGIVHDTSASGQTLYVEPMIAVEPTNRLREGLRAEQEEIARILAMLSAQLAEHSEALDHLYAVLIALDQTSARAAYATWLVAVKPTFQAKGCNLVKCRHPLLVWQERHEQGVPVVPIDLPIDPEISAAVITGPNTGGKTVTLKTLGLLVLMAQAGLFIPAQDPAYLPWFDQVLADIGDEQSIEQSLSTFSGHIRRIVRILDTVTSNSLVLLDEVGAGTDPQEGSALARSLLVHLAERSGLTLATTHYGELKALKYSQTGFENASVEFDVQTLAPTYRLLWGIPGRSNALTIARRLGLSDEIITTAQAGLQEGEAQLDEVIGALQGQLQRQESQVKQAETTRRQVEKLQSDLLRQQTLLDQREAQMRERQDRELREVIAEARSEVASVIRKLQRGNVSAQEAQEASNQVQGLATQYLAQPIPEPTYRPHVGDKVEIISLAQTGEILTLSDNSEQALVRVGTLKLTVPLSQLRQPGTQAPKPKAPRQTEPQRPTTPRAEEPLVRTESQTVDLRGKRVHEAEILLEPELNLQRGPLWVIHGHGTGKLREGVHQILERHPRVARFELAGSSDGGNGVTIVFLK